jgi:hypothetical protein
MAAPANQLDNSQTQFPVREQVHTVQTVTTDQTITVPAPAPAQQLNPNSNKQQTYNGFGF